MGTARSCGNGFGGGYLHTHSCEELNRPIGGGSNASGHFGLDRGDLERVLLGPSSSLVAEVGWRWWWWFRERASVLQVDVIDVHCGDDLRKFFGHDLDEV